MAQTSPPHRPPRPDWTLELQTRIERIPQAVAK